RILVCTADLAYGPDGLARDGLLRRQEQALERGQSLKMMHAAQRLRGCGDDRPILLARRFEDSSYDGRGCFVLELAERRDELAHEDAAVEALAPIRHRVFLEEEAQRRTRLAARPDRDHHPN